MIGSGAASVLWAAAVGAVPAVAARVFTGGSVMLGMKKKLAATTAMHEEMDRVKRLHDEAVEDSLATARLLPTAEEKLAMTDAAMRLAGTPTCRILAAYLTRLTAAESVQ